MRGKVKGLSLMGGNPRITPAYAGKSWQAFKADTKPKDHPRLCGEKVFQTSEKSTLAGSPPPMRGKVFWLLATLCQPGITPAYAGKSQNHRPTHLVQKDHPRLCGEKFMRWAMRRISNRITPAYAGKRPRGGGTPPDPRDHPRLCGEKDGFISNIDPEWGSPPPMRGKVPKMDPMQGQSRITPAYAGKSA